MVLNTVKVHYLPKKVLSYTEVTINMNRHLDKVFYIIMGLKIRIIRKTFTKTSIIVIGLDMKVIL